MPVVNIHPTRLGHGGRRGVAVVLGAVAEGLGIVAVKEFLVGEDLPGGSIHAEHVVVLAIFRRGSQPDLVVDYDGRRQAEEREFRLPGHVFGFTPSQRQFRGIDVAILVGASEVGPVVGGGKGKREGQAGECEGAELKRQRWEDFHVGRLPVRARSVNRWWEKPFPSRTLVSCQLLRLSIFFDQAPDPRGIGASHSGSVVGESIPILRVEDLRKAGFQRTVNTGVDPKQVTLLGEKGSATISRK